MNTRSPNLISKLSFSLMSGSELSLLDLDAVHAAQLAEWTDGLRVLGLEGGMITKETASYVHVSMAKGLPTVASGKAETRYSQSSHSKCVCWT